MNYDDFCRDVLSAAEGSCPEYAKVLKELLQEQSIKDRIVNPGNFVQMVIWTKSEILNFAMEIAHDTWEDYNCGHPDDMEVGVVLRLIAEEEVKIQDKNAEHGWVISQDDIEYDVREVVRALSEERPELFEGDDEEDED